MRFYYAAVYFSVNYLPARVVRAQTEKHLFVQLAMSRIIFVVILVHWYEWKKRLLIMFCYSKSVEVILLKHLTGIG